MTDSDPPRGEITQVDLSEPVRLRDLERWAIEAAVRRTKGNLTQAMRELGIGRTTMYRKLKKYGHPRAARWHKENSHQRQPSGSEARTTESTGQ